LSMIAAAITIASLGVPLAQAGTAVTGSSASG
jgi:hypothetical protein